MKLDSRLLRFFLPCLILLLTACSPSGDTAGENTESKAPEKRFLSIGTAPTGGTFFVVGGTLAEVADKFGKDQGWTVTAEATAGSQENIRRLVSGDLDFALSNSAISHFAARGESSWDQVYDIRAVMTLAPNVALFVSPKGSGVETLADLAGQRVAIGPAGAGFEMFVGPILAAHGVSYDDFNLLNAPQSAAVDLLSDGNAAAAFLGGAVPTTSIVQASTSMDLHLVPYGAAEMEELKANYPFFASAVIPAETYRGQTEDYNGLNVGSMHLIAAANADEDMVYQLTKTLWEHREDVAKGHPAGKAINPKVAARYTGTAFHPGAERFYREIGIWPTAEPEVTTAEGEADTATATEAGEG